MSITVQGHSDDVVCVAGQVSDEFYAQAPVILKASTGHQLLVSYGDHGIWRISHHGGPEDRLTIEVCDGTDEDVYSDVARIDADVKWVRCRPTDMDDPAELNNPELADLLDEIVCDFGPYRQELGDLAAAHEAVDRLREVRPLRVEVYESTVFADDHWPEKVEYRWRVVHSSNGEVMASGEGYADRRDRDRAVEVLFPGVEIVEVES